MSRRARPQGPLRRALAQVGEDLWLQGVAIVGAYLTLCLNLREAGQRLTTGGALMVVMTDSATREDGLELARQIAAQPEAAEARFVDRAQALTRFRSQLGPHAGLLDGLEDNPLHNAVELFLAPGRSPDEALLARLKALPQVGEVVTGRPWLSGLERAARSLGEMAWALGGVLLLGVVLLVMNTVRRDQLEILDLVGAKPAYARWPFVLEAVIQASLASALIWALMQLLKAPGELPLGLDLDVLLPQLAGVLGVGPLPAVARLSRPSPAFGPGLVRWRAHGPGPGRAPPCVLSSRGPPPARAGVELKERLAQALAATREELASAADFHDALTRSVALTRLLEQERRVSCELLEQSALLRDLKAILAYLQNEAERSYAARGGRTSSA